MKFSISTLALSLWFMFCLSAYAADSNDSYLINSTLKLKTYEQNDVTKEFLFSHYGSAVFIGKNLILTNSHVIQDADNKKPTWYYEACYATPNNTKPSCFTKAKLIAYDELSDLALLEISQVPRTLKPVKITKSPVSMGSKVIVYGYPSIWWNTITRTEWKIGWKTDTSYKFDGTIDHGNSWGSAFNESGELIGIPYAVSSDNGVIGYIIPSTTVDSFLAKKTDGYTVYSSSQNAIFSSFLSTWQKIEKWNINNIRHKLFQIKGLNAANISYLWGASSVDGNIIDFRYGDALERNILRISCLNNIHEPLGFSDSLESLWKAYEQQNTVLVWSGEYIDKEKSVYYLPFTAKQSSNGEKAKIWMYFALQNGCYAMIISTDGEKKDKNTYDKLYTVMKNIKFTAKENMKQEKYVSPYFSTNTLPKNVSLSYGTTLKSLQIVPQITFHFPDIWLVTSEFMLYDFDNLDEYMTFADDAPYTSKSYSFRAFYDRYVLNGYSDIVNFDTQTNTGDKFIFISSDYSDLSATPAVKNIFMSVIYPFKTNEGKLHMMKFTFDMYSNNSDYVHQIRTFFENLDFPWTNPFGK